MGVTDYHTCFLRNLYAGQEATETDMEQLTVSTFEEELQKSYVLSLFT